MPLAPGYGRPPVGQSLAGFRRLRAGRVLLSLLSLLSLLGVLAAPPGASAAPGAQTPGDWSLPRAHFYTQAAGDTPRPDDGFLVADRPGFGFPTGRNVVRFWSEFRRYGGVAVVGYPASRPLVWDGFDVQAFQKGVFQWRPEQGPEGRAWFVNVFDEFTRRGLDGRLLAEKQVPLPGSFDDRGKSFVQITAERLALLDRHPALLRQYRSAPDPVALYGLPNSAVQDLGPFYAVRLQRAAFQEWKVDVPGIARAGQVTVVNAGDVAKEYGLIPGWAAHPVSPPVPASDQVAVYTPGREEGVGSPFTVAGDARAFEATVLWELTEPLRGDVLGRGVTTARGCCEWSSFEFAVPYAVSRPLRATLAVWGSSGRDGADRPGEVRVALDLQDAERPAAARDGWRLIEPLRVRAEGSPSAWLVVVRVRNESGSPITVAAADFGLRDDGTGAVEWSDPAAAWDLGAGESREVALRFVQVGPGAAPGAVRLLHRAGRLERPRAPPGAPVVIDLPEPDTGGGPGAVAPPPSQPPPLQAALADAVRRAGLDPSVVRVLRTEQRQWPDSSLGCPRPGLVYARSSGCSLTAGPGCAGRCTGDPRVPAPGARPPPAAAPGTGAPHGRLIGPRSAGAGAADAMASATRPASSRRARRSRGV